MNEHFFDVSPYVQKYVNVNAALQKEIHNDTYLKLFQLIILFHQHNTEESLSHD